MASPYYGPPPPYRRSLVGPVILILIGTLFLAKEFIGISVWAMFARWWPVLLILAGLIKIAEYEWARRSGDPGTRFGGGSAALLIFIAIFGLTASAIYKHRDEVNWGQVHDEFSVDDDLMKMFGSEHIFDSQVEQALPANGSLKVVCDRGSVTINVIDENKVKVTAHKKVFASNDSEAQKRDAESHPTFTVNGSQVVLNANTKGGGEMSGIHTDLDVSLPRNASVEVTTRKGDITIMGRNGSVKVTDNHGDITVEDVNGEVYASVDRGNTHAVKITGNVTVDGKGDDIALDEITGAARINGEFFGDIRLSKITKGLHFTSSHTDLQVARLDGELNLDPSDLRITNAFGPVVITARSKGIDVRGIAGDLKIDSDVGEIAIESSTGGNIEVTSHRGAVKLQLPSKAGFEVNALTRKGEVQTDFESIKVTNPDKGDSTGIGTVGKGGNKVRINSELGDIEIRKSVAEPRPPSPPPTPEPR